MVWLTYVNLLQFLERVWKPFEMSYGSVNTNFMWRYDNILVF